MKSSRDALFALFAVVGIVVCGVFSNNTPGPVEQPMGFMATAHAPQPRSGHWPKVRDEHLAKNPVCIVCGSKGSPDNPLNVHHRLAFHVYPHLECDPSNLRTLCREHHLWWGHLGNWSSWNVDIDEDAAAWRKKIENRP